MKPFSVSLAGIPVGIMPYTSEIREFFLDYVCAVPPCFVVEASKEDLEFERVQSTNYYQFKNIPARSWSDSYLERLALLRLIANHLPDYNAILFHGAVLSLNHKAYLFTAPSGTGKTTHINLWMQLFSQAYVLNGDKPFLRVKEDGCVVACGTPWRGKEHLGKNEILPLEAICFLEQDKENHIKQVALNDELNALLHQAHIPDDPSEMMKALQLVTLIGSRVRLFRMGCNMDPEAALISSRAMLSVPSEARP